MAGGLCVFRVHGLRLPDPAAVGDAFDGFLLCRGEAQRCVEGVEAAARFVVFPEGMEVDGARVVKRFHGGAHESCAESLAADGMAYGEVADGGMRGGVDESGSDGAAAAYAEDAAAADVAPECPAVGCFVVVGEGVAHAFRQIEQSGDVPVPGGGDGHARRGWQG